MSILVGSMPIREERGLSPSPDSIEKCRALIRGYQEKYRRMPMQVAVDAILEDREFLALSAEEKAVLAIMLCAKAR